MFPRIFSSFSSNSTPTISRPLTPIEDIKIAKTSTTTPKVETDPSSKIEISPYFEKDHQNPEKCPFEGCKIVGNHTIADVENEDDNSLNEKLKILANEIREGFKIVENNKEIHFEEELIQKRAKRLINYYSKTYIWHIKDYPKKYSLAKNGKVDFIESPKFLSHRFGYVITVFIAPFGDLKTSQIFSRIHVSINPGKHDAILAWHFMATIVFTIYDQNGTDHRIIKFIPKIAKEKEDTLESFMQPNEKSNTKFASQKFIKIDEMEEGGKFVKNGQVFIGIDFENLSFY